jgi:Response regulator containing a CheY-like receiver domain and an HTH DNA-binding domain
VSKRARCLVADDHPAILSAVTDFLQEEGIDVVAQARDGQEALAKIESVQPDVAVVDLQMPGLTGIELARKVTEARLPTGIVLYTGHGDRALLTEAVDVGARGYVLKEAPLPDLLRAISTVAQGGTYVDPVLAGALAAPGAADKLPALTQREREVLRLLADGLTNEEVGRRLFIAPDTVRTHVRKAMRKLDADTRTQAVATALRQSLIS